MEENHQAQNTGVIVAVIVLLIAAVGLVWYFMSEVDIEEDPATTEQSEAVDPEEEEFTVAELVENDSQYSTLASALETTDLLDVLDSEGEFTLFAPTNAAFEALPEGELDALMNDPEALREVLLYHVVEQEISASMLDEVAELETVQGSTIAVSAPEGETGVGVSLNNEATIVEADSEASNGYVHAIDNVLQLP